MAGKKEAPKRPTRKRPTASSDNKPKRKSSTDKQSEKKRGTKSVRGARGRFGKGNCANPNGRPRGSKNKKSLAAELLEKALNDKAPELVDALIKSALEGQGTALKLVLERICPAPKERLIELPLPKINSLEDVTAAHGEVLKAVASGICTPEEGRRVAELIELNRNAIMTLALEERLAAMEAWKEQHDKSLRH